MVTWIGSYPTQAYQVDKKRGLIHHPSLLRKEKLLTYAIKNHAILKVKLPGVVCFDVSWYWFIKLDNKCKVGLSTYKTKNKKIEISYPTNIFYCMNKQFSQLFTLCHRAPGLKTNSSQLATD